MLEVENTPEAEARIENLNELMNAAAEAVERGETIGDFLDHAALVADADSIDEQAQITLMTIHNAKGLEFPVVFHGRNGGPGCSRIAGLCSANRPWKKSGGFATWA